MCECRERRMRRSGPAPPRLTRRRTRMYKCRESPLRGGQHRLQEVESERANRNLQADNFPRSRISPRPSRRRLTPSRWIRPRPFASMSPLPAAIRCSRVSRLTTAVISTATKPTSRSRVATAAKRISRSATSSCPRARPRPTSSSAKPQRNMKTLLLAVAAAFGVGLLLTFTPCVLPMIPILSSVIVGSSDRHVTKLEGGLLSSAYVLSTAVTYTVAGVIAGTTGDQLQAYFQHPAAIVTFGTLLGFLALSMFGFYELQLPAFLQSELHKHSADIHLKTRHTKVGALFGVFGMGLVAALIVGACVSPLLISALGVAIANRDPVLGGAIMFAMALGMGEIGRAHV